MSTLRTLQYIYRAILRSPRPADSAAPHRTSATMSMPRQHQPVAPKTSQVVGPNYRLTILTDGLIRYEWSEDGEFEDRASTFALKRNLPTPKFELIETEERIEIITSRFSLDYDKKAFSPSGFTVVIRADGESFELPGAM